MISRLSQFKAVHVLIAYSLGLSQAFAQPIQTDGQILRSLPKPPPPLERELEFKIEADKLNDITSGGEEVLIYKVKISGNTIFSEQELVEQLGDVVGRWFDFSQIQAMANHLSNYYRDRGYSFAKVYIPKQSVSDRVLEFVVLEGKYGEIRSIGDEKYQAFIKKRLSTLKSGEVINGPELERIFLKLGDVPGVRVIPVLRPGRLIGSGDLDVRVVEDDLEANYVAVDNQGSRLSGINRVSAGIFVPSIFGLPGHQLRLSATATNKDLEVYSIGYGWQLFNTDARIRLDYTDVTYDLRDSTDQRFNGDTKIYRATVTNNLFRSQLRNLVLQYGYQERDAFSSVADTPVSDGVFRTFPISLGFYLSDNFMSGGSFSGSFTYTRGRVQDSLNTNTELKPRWSKYALDVTRSQKLGSNLNATFLFSGQTAEDPIMDSSEQMSLGGTRGVRAYPSGEGSFTRAYVSQIELQYRLGFTQPYIFMDHGKGSALQESEPNDREIGGYGFGLRAEKAGWSFDAHIAHKRGSGISTSDVKFDDPVFQLSLRKRF